MLLVNIHNTQERKREKHKNSTHTKYADVFDVIFDMQTNTTHHFFVSDAVLKYANEGKRNFFLSDSGKRW